MVAERRALLHTVVLHPNVPDQWHWYPSIMGIYTVRTGYHFLTSQDLLIVGTLDVFIWHKKVSLKVSILAWRLLHDMLPTKTNLLNQGILSSEATICSTACGQDETASHLFLHCDMYAPLWQMVRSLLGVSGVDPQGLHAHFFQFTNCLGGLKACRSFLQLLWLLCVWLIWQEHNNRLFKNSQLPISEHMDKVKFHSYWWLKANNTTFVFGSQRWWSEPLRCLGIG